MKAMTFAIVIAGVLGVSGAFAQVAVQTAEPKTEKKAQKSETAAGRGGSVVFVDPVTQQLRQPSAEEIGTLSRPAAATASAEPRMINGPGTAVGVVLEESYDVYMAVSKTADGKLVTECVTGGKKAAEVVSSGVPMRKPAVKGGLDVQ